MAGRVPVIAGNWKLFKTAAEGAAFVVDLSHRLGQVAGVEVVVAPPFTALDAAVRATEGSVITVAAQDVFWAEQGAYTGEVAPGMLRALGVRWAIIGHSERRQLFGETDEGVARKARAALDAGLVPIVCVGETEAEREMGLTEERLAAQLSAGLAMIAAEEAHRVVVAYEPVWAIGTGKTATPEMAQEACAFVRERLAAAWGSGEAEGVRILYGGSMKPENARQLMTQPDIDGGLVGGASLEVGSFAGIVEQSR
jgi:triosephosphate isomerase (TIM)